MSDKLLLCLISILLLCSLGTHAQDTSVQLIDEVMITGVRESNANRTSLRIKAISQVEFEQKGSFNLSDALAKQPGISQMSTGPGISKPVIHGLYGNRVLILVSSMKFDNQQWQDEHGLGLSEIGVARMELIKGPASVLYGSDAVGGVVNIIEDKPKPGEQSITVQNQFFSNTLGYSLNVAWKKQERNHWFRLLAGYENHGDYSDGNNARVLNSRYNGVYAKFGGGFDNGRWRSAINYHFSLNQFGFIMPDLGSFFTPDNRWSRSMDGPHHIVMFNLLAWENRIKLQHSILKVNLGFQTNQRKEDEGGGSISLNMMLISVPYSLQWIHAFNAHTELIISHIGSFENNTNYGGRKIVPDANMLEEGIALFLKESYHNWILELGTGAHIKYIKTLPTGILNTKDNSEIVPFTITNVSANGMLGLVYLPTPQWVIKLNASTGHRAPNLAELSSNGLHEGTYQYEIGDPNLKNEQNVNTELSATFTSRWVDVEAEGYVNQFFSYIYLAPTSEEFFGFQVYRYYQNKARLAGGEAMIRLHPPAFEGLEWTQSYSYIKGTLYNGDYLPFIPPQQWKNEIRYTRDISNKIEKAYVFVSGNYVLKKTDVAIGETNNPAYFLLGAGLGGNIRCGKQRLELYLAADNLLNKVYTNHLSRLKAYGIKDMGRNFVLTIKIPINY